MSGIFGFTCRDDRSGQDVLSALETWNKPYGREGHGSMLLERTGIGCFVEHFSDAFCADQPILSAKNGYAVIDALLYNRTELIARLEDVDASVSDERLLLKWIESFGFEALKEVNGDFAGAIYDEKSGEWMLFRDHMGVRPLFVYEDGSLFAFSSDIRGLAAIPGVDLSLNEKQLYLLTAGYNALSLTETEFERINCVKPASRRLVRVSAGGFASEEATYWSLGSRKIRLSKDEDYIREMRRLVEDAVRVRLDAFPGIVGGELSGGLDSCVIDILINRLGREGRYFSWSVDPKVHPMQPGDERLIIEEICRREGICCDYQPGTADSYDKLLGNVFPAYVNTLNISHTSAHLHAQGVRAVFTGHGGDEGVSHRCNQMELWHCGEYAAYCKEKWQETAGRKLRLLRTLKHIYHGVAKEHLRLRQPWEASSSAKAMLREDFLERMKKTVRPQPLWFTLDPKAYIGQGGSRNRLDNVALQGAENGVRYLVPFLDYRVIDFAVSIPRRLYRKNGVNRWIFREAFKDVMPESLYKLNSKDTPSQQNFTPKGITSFEDSKKLLLTKLDWKFWSKYFDVISVGRCLTAPQQLDMRAYYQLSFAMNQLFGCAMIQSVRECSGYQKKEHE